MGRYLDMVFIIAILSAIFGIWIGICFSNNYTRRLLLRIEEDRSQKWYDIGWDAAQEVHEERIDFIRDRLFILMNDEERKIFIQDYPQVYNSIIAAIGEEPADELPHL
jgi:hypothetical protein